MAYQVEISGLSEAVGRVTATPKHEVLLAAIRRLPGLEDARLLTHRDGAWLGRRRVLTASSEPVADDHRAWLEAELERDGGRAQATAERLRGLDHRLTECAIDSLYVVQGRGSHASNFVQIQIDLETERIDRRLFSRYAGGWRNLRSGDLDGLVDEAEDGERIEDGGRTAIRPPTYRLKRAIDAGAFVREAALTESTKRVASRRRLITMSTDGRPPEAKTIAEAFPEPGEWVWPGQRWMDDWALSSAGRSGRPLCAHWALQISDYTSPAGERSMSLIPLWTHTRKIAALTKPPKSDYELYGKLEAIDRRVGVPFAWYFYMLHGNLVRDWAGERVLKAAEAGTIVLPEHDYQILRRWSAQPYGF